MTDAEILEGAFCPSLRYESLESLGEWWVRHVLFTVEFYDFPPDPFLEIYELHRTGHINEAKALFIKMIRQRGY